MSDYLPDLIGALGTTFKRLVRKIVLPNNAKTGQARIEVGADTPPELVAYGILNALLFYITDKNSGIEVGYFFIGMTNSIDGGAAQMANVYGNVTYPTPGDPTSPTAANVKTNFQQDLFTQNPDTIFKDHNVIINPGISILFAGPGNVQVAEPVATNGILTGFVTGDTVIRVQMRADGRIDWGPGGNANLDTDLYRAAAGILKTDNNFTAANGVAVIGGNLSVQGAGTTFNASNAAIVGAGANDVVFDNGRSAHRGLVGFSGNSTGTIVTVSSTAETDTFMGCTAFFKNGRRYKARIKFFIQSATVQGISLRAHLNSVGGTTIAFFGVFWIGFANVAFVAYADIEMRNDSGADISRQIFITINLLSGSASASIVTPAIGTNVNTFDVQDYGYSADNSLAFAVT